MAGIYSPGLGQSSGPGLMTGPPQNTGMPSNNPLTNQYNLYNKGVEQNATDYGNIMQGYQNISNQQTPQLKFAPTQYQTIQMQSDPNFARAMQNLGQLSQTGGYDSQGISDLRARGISPIRSIYSSAQQNVDRQRALSGGYSPNYGAVQAKLARDESSQIAGQESNVNAGIAQNVAANKLQVAPQYAGLAEQNQNQMNQVQEFNANAINRGNEFNAQLPLQFGQYNQQLNNQKLQALNGMSSLYGTTPAMSALFGNQALGSANLQNNINQAGNQQGLQLISSLMRN